MHNTTNNDLSLAQLRLPVAQVVAKYFGGDTELFANYQASCAEQFPIDLSDGQAAWAVADAQALMRTAHNLKSILLMLGFTSISQEAASCERHSQTGQVQQAMDSWNRLARLMAFVLTSGALHPQTLSEIAS